MSPPWMPLYVADYIKDTGHLSAAEHGAYLLLIMHYWSTGRLPIEDRRLASIARLPLEEWEACRETIAAFFDDGWRHGRIDKELEKSKKSYDKRAIAGRKGGIAKTMKRHSSSIATAEPQAGLKLSQPQPDNYDDGDARGTRDRRLEAECRKTAGDLPVLVDTNFAPVLVLLDSDPALTEADVLAAVFNVVTANHRLKFWAKLEPWIRRAARDRLAAAMAPTNYARAGPASGGPLSPSYPPGNPANGTSKTPSDFLRSVIKARADNRETGDRKLLSG